MIFPFTSHHPKTPMAVVNNLMDMTPLQVSCRRGKFLRQTQSGTPSTNIYTWWRSRRYGLGCHAPMFLPVPTWVVRNLNYGLPFKYCDVANFYSYAGVNISCVADIWTEPTAILLNCQSLEIYIISEFICRFVLITLHPALVSSAFLISTNASGVWCVVRQKIYFSIFTTYQTRNKMSWHVLQCLQNDNYVN